MWLSVRALLTEPINIHVCYSNFFHCFTQCVSVIWWSTSKSFHDGIVNPERYSIRLLFVLRSISSLGLRKHAWLLYHRLHSTQIHSGNYFIVRTNRTHLKEDYFAVGALKQRRSADADYDDDLLTFLGVESISEVTFFSRLQIGGATFHSRTYKRVFRRNNYTIAYQQGESICYGQIEVFFVVRDDPRMSCGAVVSKLTVSNQHVCKLHEVLGNPVTHIVCLQKPNRNRFTVVPLEDIIDICVYMEFSDCTLGYAALFPNHIERDWIGLWHLKSNQ